MAFSAFELESEISKLAELAKDDKERLGDESSSGSDVSESEENIEKNMNSVTKAGSKYANNFFGLNVNTLWRKKKRKKRVGRTVGSTLPKEVSGPLEKANDAFIKGDNNVAVLHLSEVVRLAPKFPDPYHIMGLIYEENKDYWHALQLFTIAARYFKKSLTAWEKVFQIAYYDLKRNDYALEAIRRMLSIDQQPKYMSKKALLEISLHSISAAHSTLNRFLTIYPNEIDFLIDFAQACVTSGYIERGVSIFLRYLVRIMGTEAVPADVLLYYNLKKCLPLKDILKSNPSTLFFAGRTVTDILLSSNFKYSLITATTAINLCIDYIKYYNDNSYDESLHLKLPLDLGLLFGICKLRTQNNVHVIAAMRIIIPLLITHDAANANTISTVTNPDNHESISDDLVDELQSISNAINTNDDDNNNDNNVAVTDFNHDTIINKLDTTITTTTNNNSNNDSDDSNDIDKETQIFILNQRIRIAEELIKLGMTTQSYKIISNTLTHSYYIIYYLLTPSQRIDLLYRISIILERCQKPEDAIETLLICIKEDPNHPRILLFFAELCNRYKTSLLPYALNLFSVHYSAISMLFEMYRMDVLKNKYKQSQQQHIANDPTTTTNNTITTTTNNSIPGANVTTTTEDQEKILNEINTTADNNTRNLELIESNNNNTNNTSNSNNSTTTTPTASTPTLTLSSIDSIISQALAESHLFQQQQQQEAKLQHQRHHKESVRQQKQNEKEINTNNFNNNDNNNNDNDKNTNYNIPLPQQDPDANISTTTTNDSLQYYPNRANHEHLLVQNDLLPLSHISTSYSTNINNITDHTAYLNDTTSVQQLLDTEGFDEDLYVDMFDEDFINEKTENLATTKNNSNNNGDDFMGKHLFGDEDSDDNNSEEETEVAMIDTTVQKSEDTVAATTTTETETSTPINASNTNSNIINQITTNNNNNNVSSTTVANGSSTRNTSWSASGLSLYLSRIYVDDELKSIVEWSSILLRLKKDYFSYLAVTMPIISSWVNKAILKQPFRKRKKTATTVTLKKLAAMTPIDTIYDSVIWEGQPIPASLIWLDRSRVSVWAFITKLSLMCTSIEKLLGRDTLFIIVQGAGEALTALGYPSLVSDLRESCMIAMTANTMNTNIVTRNADSDKDNIIINAKNVTENNGSIKNSQNKKNDSEPFDNEDAMGVNGWDDVQRSGTMTLQRQVRVQEEIRRRRGNGDWRIDIFIQAAAELSPEAKDAANLFCLDCHNVSAANTLIREVLTSYRCKNTRSGGGLVYESYLPVHHVSVLFPHSATTLLLAGHDLVVRHKYAAALHSYLAAFCLDPMQPVTSLSLSVLLLFLSQHLLVKHRHEVLVKAFTFIFRYASLRLLHCQAPSDNIETKENGVPTTLSSCDKNNTILLSLSESNSFLADILSIPAAENDPTFNEVNEENKFHFLSLKQETLYNIGRVFDEIKLHHLARDFYIQALELSDRNPVLNHCNLNLTREAAHNLVLIYKRAGSKDLALEIMLKYLLFEY